MEGESSWRPKVKTGMNAQRKLGRKGDFWKLEKHKNKL